MREQINFIFCALLSTILVVGESDFFEATGLMSENPNKSRFKKDYVLIDKISLSTEPFPQTNNRPIVKIIAPKDKSSYPMETRVTYEISVSDNEDGESKYGEIFQNEVLLKVEYLENKSRSVESDKNVQNDSMGLTGILTSNCLNCHAFKGKLIGPSFYEISKHDEPTQSNLQTMVMHVKEGSSGVWGNAVMPSHPELSNREIQKMVQWIMDNAGKSNIDYYTGTEGSIKLTPPPDSQKNISFVLTASYSDHGTTGGQKLKGQDSVVIYSK